MYVCIITYMCSVYVLYTYVCTYVPFGIDVAVKLPVLVTTSLEVVIVICDKLVEGNIVGNAVGVDSKKKTIFIYATSKDMYYVQSLQNL